MPHRPSNKTVRRDGHIERRLRARQRTIIAGRLAVGERDAILAELYERGYTQVELAAILNEELAAHELPPVKSVAVYKALRGQRP